MAPRDAQQADFFISYKADSEVEKHQTDWATWVAKTLEDHGYTTILQAWDFHVGSNIMVDIHHALNRSDRMIALLSPAYLESSHFTQAEWAAKLIQSPDGSGSRLIPLIVEECQPTGLLSPLVYQRLDGLDERAARKALLRAVAPGERRRAAQFPGSVSRSGASTRGAQQPRGALMDGGISRLHLTRSDYATPLRDYLDKAQLSITIVSIYLTIKGHENDLLEVFERKLKGSDVFQATVSLLDPTMPVLQSAALTLSMPEADLKAQIESMAQSLLQLRNSLPRSVRRRLSVRLHATLPTASAVLLDENLSTGRIQLETRLYRGAGSDSFGFEVESGTDFYIRLLNSYHLLIRDSADAKSVLSKQR